MAKTKEMDLATAQAEVDRLSSEAAEIHRRLGIVERELEGARNAVGGGEARASDRLAQANQQAAHLREEQRRIEGELVKATEQRDAAAKRDELTAARQRAERAAKVRELMDQRKADAERVQAAIQELADAISAADETAVNIRRAGGQSVTGDAVARMMGREPVARALWAVKTEGGQPLGRRIGVAHVEQPHRRPFLEFEEGARNRLLSSVAKAEQRPAELEAELDGKAKERAA